MTEEDRREVREQMGRLLETHHFNNSRRYPALLRFIVEETLEGRGEYLKERLLGVRVFDRPANYDTASDPIVRVTVAEIRKRIAQYYHDEAHDGEMRIELVPGRYVPAFRPGRGGGTETLRAANQTNVLPQTVSTQPVEAAPIAGLGTSSVRSKRAPWLGKIRHIWGYVAATALLLLLASLLGMKWLPASALDDLWTPVLASQRPLLFCLPTEVGKKVGKPGFDTTGTDYLAASRRAAANAAGPTFLDHESMGENVVYSDMLATLSISGLAAAHHHDYRVRLTTSTTLEDLEQGPTVLIGGLDNQWTMRALAPLRFHFAGSDEDQYWIADSSNIGHREWSLDLKQPYATVTRDYALVARLHNQQTGQIQVIVAGIGMSGTAAAGEFITDSRRVEELRRRVGNGFKSHDFEAVLSTDVVNGIAGSAQIVAVAVR